MIGFSFFLFLLKNVHVLNRTVSCKYTDLVSLSLLLCRKMKTNFDSYFGFITKRPHVFMAMCWWWWRVLVVFEWELLEVLFFSVRPFSIREVCHTHIHTKTMSHTHTHDTATLLHSYTSAKKKIVTLDRYPVTCHNRPWGQHSPN